MPLFFEEAKIKSINSSIIVKRSIQRAKTNLSSNFNKKKKEPKKFTAKFFSQKLSKMKLKKDFSENVFNRLSQKVEKKILNSYDSSSIPNQSKVSKIMENQTKKKN